MNQMGKYIYIYLLSLIIPLFLGSCFRFMDAASYLPKYVTYNYFGCFLPDLALFLSYEFCAFLIFLSFSFIAEFFSQIFSAP